MKKFTYYKQADRMDCGPSCLRMVAKYYGRSFSLQRLRELSGINKEGVSLLGISEAAEKLGFRTQGVKLTFDQLKQVNLPCIVHWEQKHFVVLYRIKNGIFYVADPDRGLLKYKEVEFLQHWISMHTSSQSSGVGLLLSPTPEFYNWDNDRNEGLNIAFLLRYLYGYKKLILQLFMGLAVGSMLQLIFPFLTQAIVDVGINTRNLSFIHVILIAQTMLFVSQISVGFIRSWILLHIGTRINISILTDFLIKLMKLPMSFFDTKMTGDIMQRMNDQKRIENFLTGSTITTFFSIFNLVVFAFALAYFNITIFLIFLTSSSIYIIWVVTFLKRRRVLDFKSFDLAAKNQSKIIQLIGGMQEIKLNNCEKQKRWEWESLQASLFRLGIKNLSLGQVQQAGAFFINEGKNILITFLVAKSVIDGHLTLGGMMAVQYIVGQVSSPIEQLLAFIQQLQDTKISIERLNEIHEMEDEEPANRHFLNELPNDKGITLKNVNFTYPGAGNEPVLKNINLYIPEGKTTAIVGMSGSGKTTILKLLLGFYPSKNGEIRIGPTLLEQIGYSYWRKHCGTVMQDGFIFSDTIANNIAVGDEMPDLKKLGHAIHIANLTDFVENFPLGLHTKIGAEGNGISQGQKQRVLIARAVYKNPSYIFFDEATNALDANNESTIMNNLESFLKGKTVLVVAHRLSTVKNADHIVVLKKGKIIEQGQHDDLVKQQGAYYELVKNQLELAT